MRWFEKLRSRLSKRPESAAAIHEGTLGWLVSLSLHVALLIALATLTLWVQSDNRLVLSATRVELNEQLAPEELRFHDERQMEIGVLGTGGLEAAAALATMEARESTIVFEPESSLTEAEIEAYQFDDLLSAVPTVSENVLVKGLGSVATSGAVGAVDRITNEIVLSLGQRPTLVVWLFDQSGSLRQQREAIISRFDHIYDELGVIEASGNPAFKQHEDKPLLTAVASFGQTAEILTSRPTDDINQIKDAVRAVSDDESGVENVFQAIAYVANRHRLYRLRAPRRNVMIVVFTDEAGDDLNQIDVAVETCRKLEMPVYVVGVPAPFGRRDSFVRYVDPDPTFDQTPQFLPVHQGPESMLPERLQLFLTGSGGRDLMLDSGFGPFGLTRLTYETGGIYFAVRPDRDPPFESKLMRTYQPEYVPAEEYRRLIQENDARAALVEAATLSWTTPLENVRLRFPKVDEAQLARDLSFAQRGAAKLEPKISQVVQTLRLGEADREKPLEPRWQAGYDLAMGQALAVQVRAEGYNAMLAEAKRGMSFKNPRNDTWLLIPVNQFTQSSALARQAEAARTYLSRVAKDHSGTPWAMMATEELRTPLGWEWRESFSDVAGQIARAEARANQPRRPQMNAPAPRPKPRRTPAL
jgi:hypothetical protein